MNTLNPRSILVLIGIVLLFLVHTFVSVPAVLGAPPAALTPTAEPPTPTHAVPPTNTPPVQPATNTPPVQPATNIPPVQPATNTPQPHNDHDGADPVVVKSVNVATAQIGDVVEFRLRVTNQGDETAKDVVVTDVLPEGLDLVDVQADKAEVAVAGQQVVVTIGNVAPGEVIDIRIRARISERATSGDLVNGATLTTSNNSDQQANNVSDAHITIVAPAAILTPSALAPTEASLPTLTPLPADPAAQAAPAARPPVAHSRVVRPPDHMPQTGTATGAHHIWSLAGLGLALIGLSLLLRTRSLVRLDDTNHNQVQSDE